MADLQEVKKQLISNSKENSKGLDDLSAGIDDVCNKLNKLIAMMKQSQLDMLENMREKRAVASRDKSSSQSGGGVTLPPLMGLGGILSAVTAIGASLTGLDDAIRAIGLVKLAKNINTGAARLTTRVGEFLKSVRNIGTKFLDFGKNLSRVIFVPEEGIKAIRAQIFRIFGLGVDGKPVVGTSDAMKALYDPKKVLMNAIKPITDFFDDLVKPIRAFFIAAKEGGPIKAIGGFFSGIAGIGKFIPRINFSALKAALGSIDEGTGLLGFFGKVASFLKPLLYPFKLVISVIARPFVQILLSAIDFIVGFFKGFFSEKGSFGQKMLAGLEGGVIGVVKGITDALDLLFVDIPAFFLKKLGFKDMSTKLKEFSFSALVDPAWEAIKKFFKRLFDNPTATLGSTVMSGADAVNNFIKSILRMILPAPNKPFDFLDPSSYVSRVVPPSVYRYAGINPKTGELMEKIAPTSSIEPNTMFLPNAMTGGGTSNVVVDNSVTNSSASSSPIVIGDIKTTDAKDPLARMAMGLGL